MPFTFKLSKRLARMKRAGTLVLLAGLTSCEQPSKLAGPGQISYLVSTMVVVPESVTLQPQGSRQFTVYGRTPRGDSVPVTVNWRVLGGAMSPSGMYSAGLAEGDYPAVATLVPPAALGAPTGAVLQRTSVVHVRSVAQIVVAPKNVTLQTGRTQQFAAYGMLTNGDSMAVSVSWVATGGTVSSSGLYTTGSAPGGYVVSASAGGVTGSATVTATDVPIASLVVSPATANTSVGGTTQLSATPKDAAGTVLTGRAVTWTSSNPAIATVSAAGLVAGVAAGSATITATSEGISASAAISVANLPVASVVVSPTTPNVYVGGTVQLTATPKDVNGIPLTGRTVTWTTSNSAVATVSASGLVTGVAVGVVTITATSEGQSGTAAVTVSNVPVASVVVSPATANILVGATTQLSATPKDAAGTVLTGRAVTWTSSNPAIATVSAAGLVAGVAAGSATITATSEGISASAAISVANVPVASVVISPVTTIMLVGATVQLTATLRDAAGQVLTGRSITWASSAPAVATVSAAGLVTGVAASAVTITATSEGKTGSAAVTVNLVPVASVTVSPASAGIQVSQTVTLTATLLDASGLPLTGRLITWASSAPAVATVASVSGSGQVTGLSAGSATITATSEGKSGTAVITVTSSGKEYYVSPSGSDVNPCNSAAPCFTMQRVSQLLTPGDIAHFASGSYSWSTQYVSVSGTASARITYISDVKWGAKISGGCPIMENTGDYVDIIGFDMTGSCVTGLTQDGNYGRIIGNRVHDLPGTSGYAGILVDCCKYTLTGNQVLGNVVDNIGPFTGTNQIHGIYVAGPNSVVANNIVTRASAACIQSYHGATHLIISNNTVAHCGRYGIKVSADPVNTTNDYTTVNNNIVVNVDGDPLYNLGIQEWPATGPNNVYNNNIVYNNSGGNFSLLTGTQSGTITLTSAQFSSLFVNYTGDASGDYHLRSGAVAIDAGTTRCAAGVSSCVPLTDFDGVARPRGIAWDIGAYEY